MGIGRKTDKGGFDGDKRPAYQPSENERSLRDRMRTIEPYREIVKQVEQNYVGKGGLKRERANFQRAVYLDKVHELDAENSDVDIAADRLGASPVYSYRKVALFHSEKWPDPSAEYPEVAFVGRSNVGKSSILNKLCRFGAWAKVSAMPGKTRYAHWFRNPSAGLDIIDLPGYGFAQRNRLFGPDLLNFAEQRTSLRALYVLIDARWGFKRADHEWLSELGRKGPLKQIVLTKCDLVPPSDLIKIASLVKSDLMGYKRVEQKVIMTSSSHNHGMHMLRKDVVQRCDRINPPSKKRQSKKAFWRWNEFL